MVMLRLALAVALTSPPPGALGLQCPEDSGGWQDKDGEVRCRRCPTWPGEAGTVLPEGCVALVPGVQLTTESFDGAWSAVAGAEAELAERTEQLSQCRVREGQCLKARIAEGGDAADALRAEQYRADRAGQGQVAWWWAGITLVGGLALGLAL